MSFPLVLKRILTLQFSIDRNVHDVDWRNVYRGDETLAILFSTLSVYIGTSWIFRIMTVIECTTVPPYLT